MEPKGGEFDQVPHLKIFEPHFLKKIKRKHISKISGIKDDRNISIYKFLEKLTYRNSFKVRKKFHFGGLAPNLTSTAQTPGNSFASVGLYTALKKFRR